MGTQPEFVRNFEWNVTGLYENSSVPRVARAVGGCGIHNAMIYMRGTERDFAPGGRWDQPGWSWDEVSLYYRRSENNTDFIASPYHATTGPVQISRVAPEDTAAASLLFQK